MEEAEIKRQEMMAAQKEKGGKKSAAPAMDARKELSKTKEQVEEECKISLNIRIKPLPLDEMDSVELISMTTNRDSSTKTMNSKNLLRGKNFSSETKLLRKVLIQNRSLVPILPLFTCSPSMNAERTPELMETERNSMKEVLRFCELKPWNQLGKRSLMNGPKDQKLNSQNGLE